MPAPAATIWAAGWRGAPARRRPASPAWSAAPRAGMPPAVARYLAAVAAYDRKFGPAGGGAPALSRLAAAGSDGAAAGRSLHRLRAASRGGAGAQARVRRRPRGRGAPGRRLQGAEGAAAADRAPRPGADRSALRDGRRVRAPAARPAPGRAALRDRLLRALVSDQGRGGGARSPANWRLSSRSSWNCDSDAVEPGKLAACGLAVINPPWRFEEAMREALPWIAGRLGPGVRAAISAPPASAPAPASAE